MLKDNDPTTPMSVTDPRVLAVPLVENHEPLIDLSDQAVMAYQTHDNHRIRKTVYEKLVYAKTLLPKHILLCVCRGDDPTGGSVQVEIQTHTQNQTQTQTQNQSDIEDQDVLNQVLAQVGLIPHPTEPQRWSYGDRHWAYCTGHRYAFYGAC